MQDSALDLTWEAICAKARALVKDVLGEGVSVSEFQGAGLEINISDLVHGGIIREQLVAVGGLQCKRYFPVEEREEYVNRTYPSGYRLNTDFLGGERSRKRLNNF